MPFDPNAPFELLDAPPAEPDPALSGARVTSYGYASDPNGDSASQGRGRYRVPTGAWDNALSDSSFAASPDIEAVLRARGVGPQQPVKITFDDGSSEVRTWDDRTAQDAQILAGKVPGVRQPLRGRLDFFSRSGPHPLDGRRVTGIEPAGEQIAAWDSGQAAPSGFDPSKPFEVVSAHPAERPQAGFDPGKPFEVVAPAPAEQPPAPTPEGPKNGLMGALGGAVAPNVLPQALATVRKAMFGTAAGATDLAEKFVPAGTQATDPSKQAELDGIWSRIHELEGKEIPALVPTANDVQIQKLRDQAGVLSSTTSQGLRGAADDLRNERVDPIEAAISGEPLDQTGQESFKAFGADPAATDRGSQIGRGLGSVLAVAGSGPMALPQMAAMVWEENYKQALAAGKPDEEARTMAQDAMVKEMPKLGAYVIGGKLVSGATGAMMAEASPVARGVAGGAAAAASNVLVSGGLRAAEGKPFAPNAEELTQDLAWGAVHGAGESAREVPGKAAPAAREPAPTAPEAKPAPAVGTVIQAPDGTKLGEVTAHLPDGRLEITKPDGEKGAFSADELNAKPKTPNETPPLSEPAPAVERPVDAAARPVDASSDSGNAGNGARSALGDPTSVKNAATDADRTALVLQPAEETNRRPWEQVQAEAQAELAKPGVPERLVEELKANPRQVSDTESAVLAHKWTEAKARLEGANDAVSAAYDRGDQPALDAARADREAAEKHAQEMANVLRAVGTKAGQGLAARRMFNAEDWSLAGMQKNFRAKLGGRPLEQAESAAVRLQYEKLKALAEKEAEIQQTKAAQEEGVRKTPVMAEIERQARVEQAMERSTTVRRVATTLRASAKAARARIQQRVAESGGKLFSGVDPEALKDLGDYAIIGASHIADGAVKLGDFTARMAKEFGDVLRPHINAIYEASKAHFMEEARKRDNEAFKVRTRKKIAELLDRQARSDFGPRAKKSPVQLDMEAFELRKEAERVKLEFHRAAEKARLANRTTGEKVIEALPKWKRAFVLSGVKTLAKLTSAAGEIMAIAPIEEAAGGLIGKVIPRVAERAPRHGGFSLSAEGKAIVATVKNLVRDVGGELRHGAMDIDTAYGKQSVAPREWEDFIGAIHGALKAPARRNEFTRAFEKRIAHAERNGIDVGDPAIQEQIAIAAYKDANAAIFQEGNRLVQGYKAMLATWAAKDSATGKRNLAGVTGRAALNYLFPVVKIPTNIVWRSLEYSFGTIRGTARLIGAMRRGFDTMKPEEADAIMKNFKRGSVGAALLLTGFLNPNSIGGYYQRGEKRKDDEPQAGGVRLFGVNIPRYLVHNPLLEQLQIGATARKVMDSKLHKNDRENQGLMMGIAKALLGLAEETPFVGQTIRTTRQIDTPEKFVGENVKGAVPLGVQQAAEALDERNGKPVRRAPKTMADYLKSGIPYLRQQVPEAKARR